MLLVIKFIFVFHLIGSAFSIAIQPRQQLSAQTTFNITGCDPNTQQPVLEQAQRDALTLAKAALADVRPLSTLDADDFTIDFFSQAAMDYFGDPIANTKYQQRIIDTFYRATIAYRGRGWSDWWNDRYVDVTCTDVHNECGPTTPAYNVYDPKLQYPQIVYCPVFFSELKSHSSLVAAIKADGDGKLKQNIRNLRSQATTVLHEWLHIGLYDANYTSAICEGGCQDTEILIGPKPGIQIRAYKAGRSKLLAFRNPQAAARNNDNYVYYAMSQFMQETFDQYPEYPTMWDPTLSPADSQKVEDSQPGAPPSVQTWELDDSPANDTLPTISFNATTPDLSNFPGWYRPILSAGTTTSLPNVVVPVQTPAARYVPTANDIICAQTGYQPSYDDCTDAFTSPINSSATPLEVFYPGTTIDVGVSTCRNPLSEKFPVADILLLFSPITTAQSVSRTPGVGLTRATQQSTTWWSTQAWFSRPVQVLVASGAV